VSHCATARGGFANGKRSGQGTLTAGGKDMTGRFDGFTFLGK
jgi:hypothetical protein